jgi:hypothetical protein
MQHSCKVDTRKTYMLLAVLQQQRACLPACLPGKKQPTNKWQSSSRYKSCNSTATATHNCMNNQLRQACHFLCWCQQALTTTPQTAPIDAGASLFSAFRSMAQSKTESCACCNLSGACNRNMYNSTDSRPAAPASTSKRAPHRMAADSRAGACRCTTIWLCALCAVHSPHAPRRCQTRAQWQVLFNCCTAAAARRLLDGCCWTAAPAPPVAPLAAVVATPCRSTR